MCDIRIFVCCHSPEQIVPKHPLLLPMQVGAALSGHHFPNFLYDDRGDHISWKNKAYCELTAQYWAWKNITAEYYGFFHYRRYLLPRLQEKAPYLAARQRDLQKLDQLGYDQFSSLIRGYDVIVPKPENMYVTAEEHYQKAPFHHGTDLELVKDIIKHSFPDYVQAMNQYLSGTELYFGNIFIMKKAVFLDYCMWLFGILGQFDQKATICDYSPQELRVDGYLAERLLGIYLCKHQKELNLLHLPRIHFYPETQYYKHRITNLLLPPSTKRRAYVKRLIQGDKQEK